MRLSEVIKAAVLGSFVGAMMPVAVVAQAGGPSAAVAPASALASASTAPPLLSMAGPTFTVPENKLSKHVVVIAYGDMRFHDPTNTKMANPAARQILVAKVAAEHPDAVQTNGDVPYKGSDAADYDVFRSETAVWREQQLRVYPAMGNHELSGGPEKAAQGVENWWNAFPDLRGRRWYSVALGKRIYLLQLDSDLPLTEGSAQMEWIKGQIAGLPRSVDYVMIGMHHPPVADIQTRIEVDHNPRPNEIALRDYLTKIQPTTHARILVTAGHIHNYERHVVGDVVYLVSGGGGAVPYQVERTPDDLYQDTDFPNFHYVKFELERNELKATMYRLADPAAATPVWQVKDSFAVKKK